MPGLFRVFINIFSNAFYQGMLQPLVDRPFTPLEVLGFCGSRTVTDIVRRNLNQPLASFRVPVQNNIFNDFA